ncbi:MAG: glycosyltransferase [Myxococcales bacterium]
MIPCYNEADRLPGDQLLAFLAANPWASVSLVNDGSVDDTMDVLQRLRAEAPDQIDVHDLRQNVGKAEAVRCAVLESLRRPFDFVGYLDADFSTLPETLGKMLKAAEPRHRFILGSRVLRAGAVIERSPRRHYLGRVFATLASIILNLRLYDTQCGAKLIERSLIDPLFAQPFLTRWLFDLELLLRLRALLGDRGFADCVIEIPLNRWIDQGSSRIRLRDLFAVPYGLMRIRAHYRHALGADVGHETPAELRSASSPTQSPLQPADEQLHGSTVD